MRAPRTKLVCGREVTEPRGPAPAAPPTNACRARLRSCGMVVGDVNLVRETMETKIWHAATDRGPREVTWSNVAGWSIKPVTSSLPPGPISAPCPSCGDPVSDDRPGRCPWCGKAGLCPGCFPHDSHSCEGTMISP